MRLADDRARAGDQVEHAGRQADLVDDLGEDERVERGDLARLEHDGAAGGQRGRDLADDLVERVVPRRDAADDADRLAHDQGVADLLLVRVVRRRAARSVPEVRRSAGRPGSCCAATGMPTSLGDDLGDLVDAGAEALGDALQVLGPLLAARCGDQPSNAALARGLTARSTSLGGALRDAAHDLFGGGVDRRRWCRVPVEATQAPSM